jgi:hypothetical protein
VTKDIKEHGAGNHEALERLEDDFACDLHTTTQQVHFNASEVTPGI